MKIHDLVEKLIENSTDFTGIRMFQIISICRDDHGMGKAEELEKRRGDLKREDSKNNVEGKNKNVERNKEESYITTSKQQNKEAENNVGTIMPHNNNITHEQSINLVANITDDKSKHLEVNNKEESTGPRWTRCLITIQKMDITSNNSNKNTVNINTESTNEDKKKFICLPNIFGEKKSAETSIHSKKFDDFIYPGFRKDLFKATWRGGEKQILNSVMFHAFLTAYYILY